MGLPKTVSAPVAQMLLPASQQIHAQTPSSASLQDSHATEDSLERQSSLPSQQAVSGAVIGKAVSMPAGSSSMLQAYAAGALQSPVEEGQEQEPSSPQRHVLGTSAAGHTAFAIVKQSAYAYVAHRFSCLLSCICYGVQSTRNCLNVLLQGKSAMATMVWSCQS